MTSPKPPPLQSELFSRAVESIVTEQELESLLKSGRKLRVKHGIDVTGALHIGHATTLWKLRALQEADHKAVILIGDTTTAIGDPTGKSKARPVLEHVAIRENAATVIRQVKSILHTGKDVLEIRRSSEWYGTMRAPEFIRLLSLVTHARLIERDMFQARLSKGEHIFMHELIYPILQGYDSVVLRSDMTIIGSDQLFNEHMGRFFQEKFGQAPQVLVALKILPGIEGGEKMSKSRGNYIGISDSPSEKFGKTMRIPDALIIPYLKTYTDVPPDEVKKQEDAMQKGENPMKAKLFLAHALVRRYHGRRAADEEETRFKEIFSQKVFEDVPVKSHNYGTHALVDILITLGLVSSKTEARRLIRQRAVEVDSLVVADQAALVNISKGTIFRVGKKKFVKIA